MENPTISDIYKILLRIEADIVSIKKTLSEHSIILNEHSRILDEHSNILQKHSKILASHTKTLNSHSKILINHSKILKEHSKKFLEHDSKFDTLQKLILDNRGKIMVLNESVIEIKGELAAFRHETNTRFEEIENKIKFLPQLQNNIDNFLTEIIEYRSEHVAIDNRLHDHRKRISDLEKKAVDFK
ncbi:MAG: hypothetical protein UU77_C0050G0003 [candidate division WWE3 bacterium GW2011_GWC1_41_7]|uniref:Uncharacterized protein n=4 Tax=Katanobacteria TaxID=422282 RepID=A0A0G0X4T3_UNCKA|nr:MAG: hypothetical protein UU72_C0001G0072 [candidate division WWE3 bacterium GW2011_GWB1_41_6]KKS19387.1 MAG: hypothetical protein UU77_C0050G0003 [candidate division WWE3 bacterium GW2011_GWC1_41_7]KKS22877.1 MAG: hypothetical protein UU80_C0001G0042 [candidate division WWE3 bacterium GW2011_GWA1_41_8]OGC57852.1 MAG: hypothetical protein A2976_01700 [candidate division WWE3 bacterium RIFCSPLOWO2_01_FULL_41_9]